MERWNLFFLIFIGIFLAIAVAFLALYYYKGRASREKVSAAPEKSEKSDGNEEKERFFYADAFDAAALLGKTAAQSGVNEKYFTERVGNQVLAFDTALCGQPARGIVYFGDGGAEPASVVYLSGQALDFEQYKAALSERFGQPEYEGEEPFARANGGAVRYAVYKTDTLKLRLSAASERDYTELRLQAKK